MPSADEVRSCRERDKLTIAEVCADLGISRGTFYEWRAEGGAPSVHHAAERQPPRPPVRIPAVAARPLARQAMTTDTRGQTCMSFYGKAGRLFPEQKAIILPEEFWA
jgi:predicted DNA-binding transcriptional regulator AlpA